MTVRPLSSPIRFPAPLRPGDVIGVTAPSTGVPATLRPRLEFCIEVLRGRGFEVVVGDCMDGDGVVSAPANDRAAELTAMLLDPTVRAVVPPWGGELAVDLMPHLDFDAIGAAEPTWLVGFSDIATLLVPLTTMTGIATLHGQNLLDTPFRVPAPLLSWLDVASAGHGAVLEQGPSERHRRDARDDFEAEPRITEFTLNAPGGWRLLHPTSARVSVQGRLVGGCIETVSNLAGTRFGDVAGFAARHAPEGLIVYVEAAESAAFDIARSLWRMRLAGWFDAANAVLVGRTAAPDSPGFTQADAVESVLGDLGLPVVLDVDCGHVPPHLSLVNGALAELTLGESFALVQTLA